VIGYALVERSVHVNCIVSRSMSRLNAAVTPIIFPRDAKICTVPIVSADSCRVRTLLSSTQPVVQPFFRLANMEETVR
jgi:hypothetical protein